MWLYVGGRRYVYVNVDDCWMAKERDADGAVVPDPKRFPSGFNALTDYAHKRGMLFGFYTAKSTIINRGLIHPSSLCNTTSAFTQLCNIWHTSG